MKTQLVESIETVELVPQILHPKKILVPVDFSETSQQAFQYALRFAEQFGCEIVLLHVVEPESVIAVRRLQSMFLRSRRKIRSQRKQSWKPSRQARAIGRTLLRQRCALGMHPTRSTKWPRTWTSI